MTQPFAHAKTHRAAGASGEVKRLMAENARLRRACADSNKLAARREVMLREGDHRIKNSLQVVVSLMGLQERRETSAIARQALRAAAARIQAIAYMHDAIQLNGSGGIVNLGALIETMGASLHAMASDPSKIKIVVKAEAVETPIALAQPIMLAVNECVVNALRHAFPGARMGAIYLSVRKLEGQVRVIIADDGIGLPADFAEGGGFGMKLVRLMTAKISGVLQIENDGGARLTLTAPIPT